MGSGAPAEDAPPAGKPEELAASSASAADADAAAEGRGAELDPEAKKPKRKNKKVKRPKEVPAVDEAAVEAERSANEAAAAAAAASAQQALEAELEARDAAALAAALAASAADAEAQEADLLREACSSQLDVPPSMSPARSVTNLQDTGESGGDHGGAENGFSGWKEVKTKRRGKKSLDMTSAAKAERLSGEGSSE